MLGRDTSIGLEFLRSLLRRRFVRAQVATSRNVGCFLRLMKAIEQYFPAVLFIMLYMVALTASVHEILTHDHSNESY